MSRVTRLLIVAVASALLISALILVSARRLHSQETILESDGWQPFTPSAVVTQPDKKAPPLDVAGCWSGEVDDDKTGVGSGFVSFVQQGKKIKKDTVIGLSFNGGPSASHRIKGDVNSKRVKLHFEQASCVVDASARLPSEDLVGSYRITKGCRLGGKFTGTFDFTFDPSGSTCL